MLLVSGGTKSFRPLLVERPDIFGTFVTPDDGNSLPDVGKWAADNGCFVRFREARFLRMLERHSWARGRCLFVTAPDSVGNHSRTVELWSEWCPRLKGLGWPVAFVAQNGADADALPWDSLDVVFLGGAQECIPCGYIKGVHEAAVEHKIGARKRWACPRCRRWLEEWKKGAAAAHIAVQAQVRGKWLHMGRVNTKGRIGYASVLGCDSVDGSGNSKWSEITLHQKGHAELFRALARQRRLTLDAFDGGAA